MQYGIDPRQLRELIIVPTLAQLGLYSPAATSLVLGTAMHESHLIALRQQGGGPALGLWQMEPATHDDIWRNFLKYRTDVAVKIRHYFNVADDLMISADQMTGNLYYACAMARIQYRRVSAPLPDNEPNALAAFWKEHYNTPLGAGTVAEALPHFAVACSLTPREVRS